jgi:hypothetical protein
MSNKNRIRKRLHELKDDDVSEDQWVDYMEEVASALGWFIVAFNDLDFEVTAAICELSAAGTNQNTDITFALMSTKQFSQKIKDLEMLFFLILKGKQNEEQLLKRANDFVKGIGHLNKERNALVHANWYSTEQEGKDTMVNLKTGIDKLGFYHEYFKCSSDYIEELESKCEGLSSEIEKFTIELRSSEGKALPRN